MALSSGLVTLFRRGGSPVGSGTRLCSERGKVLTPVRDSGATGRNPYRGTRDGRKKSISRRRCFDGSSKLSDQDANGQRSYSRGFIEGEYHDLRCRDTNYYHPEVIHVSDSSLATRASLVLERTASPSRLKMVTNAERQTIILTHTLKGLPARIQISLVCGRGRCDRTG